jgi:hypothetical protein
MSVKKMPAGGGRLLSGNAKCRYRTFDLIKKTWFYAKFLSLSGS